MSQFATPQITWKTVHEDVVISIPDDVKVRVPPKQELDEKGKPKKTTTPKKDPKDPDSKLPGIAGDPKDIKKDKWIYLAVAQPKDDPKKTVATIVLVAGDFNPPK